MSVSWILSIISGQRRGPIAAVVRLVLWCLTPLYRFIVQKRNLQFDSGSREIVSVDAKVISIGNLTTGGTGKTPMVVWVCGLLKLMNVHAGIVSRGYAANGSAENDEALELGNRLPDVPHVQFADRVSAANRCIASNAVKAVVLDDGFQHRRLARDLDIVLIDASNPFGYGYLLPRGLLREPVSSLGRADVVVVTRCDRIGQAELADIKARIASKTSAPIVLSQTKATSLMQHSGEEIELCQASSHGWFIFSAIGNPAAFEASLSEMNFDIRGSQHFRDHHHFSKQELAQLAERAKEVGATRLVCTHKDLVKVGQDIIEGLPVFALKIDLEVTQGREILEQAIAGLFDGEL